MKLLGRILCLMYGHKRGRRLSAHKDGIRPGFDKFECPRCHATWTRKKPKPTNSGTPTDGSLHYRELEA